MPLLPICDADGRPLWSDLPSAFAVMLFPDDEPLRAMYLARAKLLIQGRHARHHGVKLTVDPELLLASIANAAPAALLKEVPRRTRQGGLAGALLEIIWALAEKHPEHASRRKAAFVLEHKLTETRQTGVTSQINEAWARFEPVVHLWAAYMARRNRFGRAFFFHDEAGYTADIDVHAFITEAEVFRRWGINHYPPPIRTDRCPLLDRERTWAPPAKWEPVDTQGHAGWPPTGRVYAYEVNDWIKRALDNYEHRR